MLCRNVVRAYRPIPVAVAVISHETRQVYVILIVRAHGFHRRGGRGSRLGNVVLKILMAIR